MFKVFNLFFIIKIFLLKNIANALDELGKK